MKKRIMMLVLQTCLALIICSCGSTETTVKEPISTEEFEAESEEDINSKEETDVEKDVSPKEEADAGKDVNSKEEADAGKDASPKEETDIATDAEPPTEKETTEAEVATEETVPEPLEDNTKKDLKEESVMTLEEWVKTPEKEETVNSANEQLAASGIKVDFNAIGNTFIYKYKFIDLMDFSGATKEEIYNNFDTNVSPVLLKSAQTIVSSFKEQYNIVIDTVRLEIYNADDTELFSKDYSLE